MFNYSFLLLIERSKVKKLIKKESKILSGKKGEWPHLREKQELGQDVEKGMRQMHEDTEGNNIRGKLSLENIKLCMPH